MKGIPFSFVAVTLTFFYVVWAAMHDLAHEGEGTLEWCVLAACALAMPLLYRTAVRSLGDRARRAWLIGTGLLVAVFSAGAVGALLEPKYANDPLLAILWLAAGVPLLAVIGLRILREAFRT